MRRFVVPLVGVLVAAMATAAVTVVAASPAGATPTAGGTFVAVKQTRLVDTRYGIGVPKAALRAGKSLTTTLAGRAPLPASGMITAVTGTVTVVSPTANGGLSLSPSSTTKPATTNLQFRTGQAVSDSSITRTIGGKITIWDTQAAGSVQVIFDVTGYYLDGSAPAGAPGTFHALSSPTRVVDSRSGLNTQHAKLAGGHTMVGSPGGHGGISASGASAVAVTITAVSPTASGSLVAFTPGTTRPTPATLYFGAGRGGSAFAIVPVSRYSQFDVYASGNGSLDVVVDAVGWFSADAPQAEGAYQPVTPHRDAVGTLKAGQTLRRALSTLAGLPTASGGAVLAGLTVVSPSRSGGLTAYSADDAKPGTTDIQFATGEERVNQVLLPVGSSRSLEFYNASAGSVTVYLDVHGYTAPNAISAPTASVGRYLNDLHDVTDSSTKMSDEQLMTNHGCNDATQNTNFVLLDVGTQSISPDTYSKTRKGHLSKDAPGVSIALTGDASKKQDPVRIQYSDLEPILDAYVDGFNRCGGSGATIAVGTNNDGVALSSQPNYYYFPTRGADWAKSVVQPLAEYANTVGISVVGAIDIEAAFSSTEKQAQDWENAYLGADKNLDLIYNGDANSCPATFGTTGATCAFGWTQSQYYSLAHNGSRIKVLPQIFFPAEAVKWADIDATGYGDSKSALNFVGSLTEHPRDPSTLSGPSGWSALNRALSSVTASPSLSQSVELNDG